MPSYATSFPLTENPISQGGAINSGNTAPNESAMQSAGGLAWGTQTGHESQQVPPLYNDSMAWLNAYYPPDQRATAIIHYNGANIAANGNLEAELYLRMSIGPLQTGLPFGDTAVYGYEINMGMGVFGLFIQIGRWKRLNLFDSFVSGSPLTSMGIHDGDVYSAWIAGNTITVTLNGVVIASATDTPSSWLPAVGSPGFGQYRHDTSGSLTPTDYCLSSWTGDAADPTLFFGAGTTS